MPKKQPRAAKVARQIQAATGIPYTDALKAYTPNGDWLALASELHAAGLIDQAASLAKTAYIWAEAGAWTEAYGVIENAYYDTEYAKVEKARSVCWGARDEVLQRAGFESLSHETDAEVYHCAYLAMSHAGTLPDGRALARAALDVIDGDPWECSDVIRAHGRTAFTYETATALTGPQTSTAIAARRSAQAMADASAVGHDGDTDWTEAAELMVKAAWHGCLAAGLPPLHERPAHQEFHADYMDGVL
ncbi:hypothetical protein [Streptomyces sp. NPDC003710]